MGKGPTGVCSVTARLTVQTNLTLNQLEVHGLRDYGWQLQRPAPENEKARGRCSLGRRAWVYGYRRAVQGTLEDCESVQSGRHFHLLSGV